MSNPKRCTQIHRKSSRRGLLLCAILAQSCATRSSAAETCKFAGTTDYAGHVSVTTIAAAISDTTQIDVVLRFEATKFPWLHLQYLVEELSQWRNGTLVRLDANTRYIFAGHIVRQQWDDFQRTGEGLQAHRIEGKRYAQFRRQYPRFAQHWDLAAFGSDWLNDYAAAAPDRRPDLDLPKPPVLPALQSPFALAFYWVRFLPPDTRHEPVFLPGFKADKLADTAMNPVAAAHGRVWQAQLHHPYLSAAPVSIAAAQIAPDGHLQSLSFTLHGSAGTASGSLHQAGCTGTLAPR